MKGKIFLLILVLCTGLMVSADDANTQFQRGNMLYQEGKYDEALAVYLQLEKQLENWKLYFNIGNCCYKLNRYVKAKIYYLRAERLQPFDSEIKKNIQIVNKKFNEAEKAEDDFLSRVMQRIESILPINLLSFLLIFLIILFNLFIFFLIKKGKKKLILYGLFFSLILVLLVSFYHLVRVNKLNTRDVAVIVKEGSQLRSGPGVDNTILFKVNPGIKVKIIERSGKWLQVSAGQQIAGWIAEESLERI